MTPFLIVKILEPNSISLPSTFVYYNVELRSSSADSQDELDCLRRSAKSQHLDFSDYAICARIATIVYEDNIDKAIDVANERFTEVLDLKSIEVVNSNFALSQIGIYKNLLNGEIKEIRNSELKPCMSFYVDWGGLQKFDSTHLLLSKKTELTDRYLKSLHWGRNARHESNQQLKTLFYWFSAEALLKEDKSDNVGDTLRWFLGYPNGKNAKSVSRSLILELNSDPLYSIWKAKIAKIVDDIRDFRNDSAHHGYRFIDVKKRDLALYNQLLTLAVSRAQAAIQRAIIANISTLPEFKEYMPIILEQNECLVQDVHRTILFMLNKSFGEGCSDF